MLSLRGITSKGRSALAQGGAEDAQERRHDVVSFDFGFLGNSAAGEKVDHVSGALFGVLTSKAVSDYVIKAMVASGSNWRRTDIILRGDGEPSCKSIQGRFRNARSAPMIGTVLLEAMAAMEWSSA